MFITFEGLDYCGKSTQAALLARRLGASGRAGETPQPVVLLRDPGGTRISERLRKVLLDREIMDMSDRTEMFLFSASRAQLVAEVIRPALDRGEIVICDRFFDSTTAYQGYGRGLNLEMIKQVNAIAAEGACPDVTIVIDVAVAEIKRRRKASGIDSDRMENAGDEFYDRVRAGYQEMAREEPERIVRIAGDGPIDRIHDEVWKHVHQRAAIHKHTV